MIDDLSHDEDPNILSSGVDIFNLGINIEESIVQNICTCESNLNADGDIDVADESSSTISRHVYK